MTEDATKSIVGEGVLVVQGTRYRAIVHTAEFKLVHRPDGERLVSFVLTGEQGAEIGTPAPDSEVDHTVPIRVTLEPRTAEGVIAGDGSKIDFAVEAWGIDDEDADFDEPGGTFYANAEHGWPKSVRLELSERNGTQARGLFGITNEDGRLRLDVETALQIHAPITVQSEIARALETGSLNLENWNLAPGDLDGLPETDRIRDIDLGYNPHLTDAGLAPLSRLRGVETLKLAGVPLTGSALHAIAGWTSLHDLNLFDTGLEGLEGEVLADLTALRKLNLTFCETPDGELAKLGRLRRLENIYLSVSKAGDVGMSGIANLDTLTTLSLRETAVGDAGIEALGAMPALQEIDIVKTGVGDRGLAALAANAPALTRLDATGCNLTAKGIAALAPLAHLTRIIADETDFGDEGLEAALSLPALDALIVRNAKTTAEGRARFRAARPHAFNFASDD